MALKNIWLRYETPDPKILGQENASLFHKLSLGFLQRALGDCGALADTPEDYLDEDKIDRRYWLTGSPKESLCLDSYPIPL